ncbi:lasso peptide biosynthesis B2 protein [Leptothoe spongobia]|uniref:Lasso peptide biosynthesis B2 protein n=1 Tax=Leptothoe spongobia TAU-MAC 1115 TaxID=1967444 RepID=A0A947DE65_9CYAN|nr:lasso peptide biosynthesis B2 protein [Leptothoe spongobia]MBT9314729.1 lasso peptide biosynthesis B2 protein [Leptothoe spongobia TAU-MAC 1115]
MNKLHRLLKLPGNEFRVLLYSCLLLNSIRLALWLLPFNFLRQKLAQLSSVWICEEQPQSVSVGFIVWTVNVAGRYTPSGAKCLVRALTSQLLLTRYGYVHQFHIGVAKGPANTLEAHAWIEYKDRVIVGWLRNLSRFKSLSTEEAKQ